MSAREGFGIRGPDKHTHRREGKSASTRRRKTSPMSSWPCVLWATHACVVMMSTWVSRLGILCCAGRPTCSSESSSRWRMLPEVSESVCVCMHERGGSKEAIQQVIRVLDRKGRGRNSPPRLRHISGVCAFFTDSTWIRLPGCRDCDRCRGHEQTGST